MSKGQKLTGRGNRRGVALLITIAVITVLTAASLELNRSVRSSVTSTAAARNRFVISQWAVSGVHGAMAILVKDKIDSEIDSIQEDWADPQKVREALGQLTFSTGTSEPSDTPGPLKVSISDELSRIQVNALVQFPEGRQFNRHQMQLWVNLLDLVTAENEAFEELNTSTILYSIKDWLDSGDDDAVEEGLGAESDYYRSLDPPYESRNGPFADLDELTLVRGISKELFYGIGETMGISNYLTVHGMTETPRKKFTYTGKININTADLPVLAAMLGPVNAELAAAIYEHRSEMNDDQYVNDLSNPTWYKNAPGCSELNIAPNLITLSSEFFRIESTAFGNGIAVTSSALVRRQRDVESGKWFCRLLSLQTRQAPIAADPDALPRP